ncbi:hypothetical protein [Microbacterium phyllosphaerae]|uniref:hypothetical protein n=1 Tax=Microbacterium phyllosphaerae TaxID=124798 RepID=UPI003D64E8D3
MTFRRRHRVLAGVAGVALLVGIGIAPTAQVTDAAFTDPESGRATITAFDVPEPVSSQTPGCVASSGLLGANPIVTIYWRVPVGVTGYSLTTTEFGLANNQGLLEPVLSNLLQNVSTTGTTTAYVTVINGALLANILGGSKTLGIRFTGPGGWESDWLVASASFGLLGANPQCVMSTAPSP